MAQTCHYSYNCLWQDWNTKEANGDEVDWYSCNPIGNPSSNSLVCLKWRKSNIKFKSSQIQGPIIHKNLIFLWTWYGLKSLKIVQSHINVLHSSNIINLKSCLVFGLLSNHMVTKNVGQEFFFLMEIFISDTKHKILEKE